MKISKVVVGRTFNMGHSKNEVAEAREYMTSVTEILDKGVKSHG